MARTDRTVDAHLEEIHHAEHLVDEIEQTRERLRGTARKELGVTGEKDSAPSFRETLSKHSLSVYPLYAICLLGMVDTFAGGGLGVLGPDIAATLGLSPGQFAQVFVLSVIAGVFAPASVARLVQSRPRRALLSIAMAFLWSLATISLGFVVSAVGLVAVLALNAFTTTGVLAIHHPLLFDSYPPEVRVRASSYYRVADVIGTLLAPLSVVLIVGLLGYTWRGVFLATGVFTFICVLTCMRLRDPGFGRWDTERIRATARGEQGRDAAEASKEVELGFVETTRRVFLIPTIRRFLIAWIFQGMALLPYVTFFSFYLEQRWGLDASARALYGIGMAGVETLALVLFARRGDAIYREDPGKALKLAAGCLFGIGLLTLAAVLSPWFWLMVGFGALTSIVRIPTLALTYPTVLSVIPASSRPHLGALLGIFGTVFGGLLGATLLGGVEARFGITLAMMSLLIPWSLGALGYRSAAKLVRPDLDRMIDDVLEEEEIQRITSSGEHLPMLACRHIDFSYGQVQVLFGVDFTVDDGEIVALLGTNGAGKSTLLKVISGIGLPSRGSVRFRGTDITYLDAERRVPLGITQ
ncbi:MAG: MFS transporter, partial [Actinobacteria bacterium]|nr:MFS transporter [Actinomycetota bacterium]